MSMKAIETVYRSYRMRSRLEARWAVFFDELGIKWEYEKEGYVLENGEWYLPDFWLPEQDCWIEIKGQEPTEAEERRVTLLVKHTHKNAYIFFGDIPMPDDSLVYEGAHAFIYGEDYGEDKVGWDMPYLWCECPDCGKVGIKFDGRADRLPCKQCYYCAMGLNWGKNEPCPIHGKEYSQVGCPRHGANLDKGYNAGSPRLLAAYTAARSARFESRAPVEEQEQPGVPPNWQQDQSFLQTKTFENFYPATQSQTDAFESVKEWAASPRGTLLLCGWHGTGKTHLLAAIYNEFKKDACFLSAFDLFTLEQRIRDREGHLAILQTLMEVPILILDELDKISPNDFRRDILFMIIDGRVNRDLPIAISVESRAQLAQVVGHPCIFRLGRRQTTIEMGV